MPGTTTARGDLVDGPVRVRVPASSANLGPGYDALGLALDLYDHVRLEVVDSGLEVTVDGAGADSVPRDGSHLVVRAARHGYAAMGVRPPGLRLHCDNVIPHGRGLGSSSAAIVGGLAAARATVVDGAARLPDDTLLALATELEGHPDNVAAALLGGLTVAWTDDGVGRAVTAPVDVSAVVLVPATSVLTEVARGLLPDAVPHEDAAHAAGRSALLVAALRGGRHDLLLAATDDRLHQGYRSPAMPDSYALVQRLRAAGWPAVISGAGPTVLVLTTPTGPVVDLVAQAPSGWSTHTLSVPPVGVEVVAAH